MADTVTDAQPEKKKPEQPKHGEAALGSAQGDKLSTAGGNLLSNPDARVAASAAGSQRATSSDLPDTQIVGSNNAEISARDLADMTQFRTDIKSADLKATAQALQEKTGGYEIKQSTNGSGSPSTLEFANKDASLANKIKVAMVESRATGQQGFYIKQGDDRLFVSADTNPADKLEDYYQRQDRKAASGLAYTVRELPNGGVITFPDSSDPAKVIHAALAEAKGSRTGLILDANDAYMGQVTPHSNESTLLEAYNQRTKEIDAAKAAKQTALSDSVRLKQELGYSIEENKDGSFKMSFQKAPAQIDTAINAAITEATGRGKRITLDIAGHNLDITASTNRASALQDYDKLVHRESHRPEANPSTPADDLSQLGLAGNDVSGQRAETVKGIQERALTRLDRLHSAGELAEKAHDPGVLRRELGLTEDQLKQMAPADRAKLGEELKGKLAAYGVAADLLPNIVNYVLHTGG
jgi:hypothetical protein